MAKSQTERQDYAKQKFLSQQLETSSQFPRGSFIVPVGEDGAWEAQALLHFTSKVSARYYTSKIFLHFISCMVIATIS